MKDKVPKDRRGKKSRNIKDIVFLDKKSFLLYLTLFAIIVLTAIYLIFFGSKARTYSTRSQMTEIVTKVRKLENNIKESQSKIVKLAIDYKKKTGKNIPVSNILDLNDNESELLKERIKLEKDVSIKNLLNEIIRKKSEIITLKKKVKFLEDLLPKPYIVKSGDNHYQIAMDFLLNKKRINKNEALKLIERSLLFEPLVPGFKVWNFYSNGEFGTFITQGTADISPNEISRREKKKLTNARDRAIDEKIKLQEDLEILISKRDDILSQIRELQSEKKNLNVKVLDLTRKVNSLFYIAGLKKDLKKKGFLKGGFLRKLKMQSVPSEKFVSNIDLRRKNTIEISASDMNLKRFRRVTIFPRMYKPGLDFRLKLNNGRRVAILEINNIKKFINEKILISVE